MFNWGKIPALVSDMGTGFVLFWTGTVVIEFWFKVIGFAGAEVVVVNIFSLNILNKALAGHSIIAEVIIAINPGIMAAHHSSVGIWKLP